MALLKLIVTAVWNLFVLIVVPFLCLGSITVAVLVGAMQFMYPTVWGITTAVVSFAIGYISFTFLVVRALDEQVGGRR